MTRSLIPDDKQAAVRRALGDAFGVTDVDDITPLAGGLSTALVFRLTLGGHPYLLRLVMPGAPKGGSPARQFACMRIAADAGVAPRIVYASVDDGLLISEFVERTAYPADMAPRLAATLRTLHAQEGFPFSINYLEVMDGMVRRFQTSGLLPDALARDFFRGYDELSLVYPRDRDLVSCHNDLRSENILFDGARVWLVDWEAAFLNDRYVDVAWASTFFVHDEAGEDAYLTAYCGRSASEYERARFYLMRQLMHVFLPAFVLAIAVRAGVAIDVEADLPDFREFHRQLIARERGLEGPEGKRDYGLVHVREALTGMRSDRFRRALTVVEQGAD